MRRKQRSFISFSGACNNKFVEIEDGRRSEGCRRTELAAVCTEGECALTEVAPGGHKLADIFFGDLSRKEISTSCRIALSGLLYTGKSVRIHRRVCTQSGEKTRRVGQKFTCQTPCLSSSDRKGIKAIINFSWIDDDAPQQTQRALFSHSTAT